MDNKHTQIDVEAKFVCGDQRELGDADIDVQATQSNGEPAVSVQISAGNAITSVTLDPSDAMDLGDELQKAGYYQNDRD
jgi:hypothetical protein